MMHFFYKYSLLISNINKKSSNLKANNYNIY